MGSTGATLWEPLVPEQRGGAIQTRPSPGPGRVRDRRHLSLPLTCILRRRAIQPPQPRIVSLQLDKMKIPQNCIFYRNKYMCLESIDFKNMLGHLDHFHFVVVLPEESPGRMSCSSCAHDTHVSSRHRPPVRTSPMATGEVSASVLWVPCCSRNVLGSPRSMVPTTLSESRPAPVVQG